MATKILMDQLSNDERVKLESLLVDFERDWTNQSLAEQVERLERQSSATLRKAALIESIKIDMERQWQLGFQTPLEFYLDNYPELGTSSTVSEELILADYEIQTQFGVPVKLPVFAERFSRPPEVIESIVQQANRDSKPADPAHSHDSTVAPAAATVVSDGAKPGATAVPENFGRYRIIAKLGEGGMGSVFLAFDSKLDRRVALKVPDFAADEAPEMMKRFIREAQAAANLRHPNLCPVHDFGEIDGIPYITMAYIEGKPLSAFINAKRLPSQRHVAAAIKRLAAALEEAHSHGVIHRDLKPSNIVMDRRGQPVILDFGLAKRRRASDERLTASGAMMGTPAYMPPEQVEGDIENMGPRSDVYSLGVVLYELLTGQIPFQGSLGSIFSKILLEDPEPPSKVRLGIDRRLEAICLKAMSKKVDDRYQSMKQFANELSVYLKETSGSTDASSDRAKKEPTRSKSADNPGDSTLADQFFQHLQVEQQSVSEMAQRHRRSRSKGIPKWSVACGLLVAVCCIGGLTIAFINGDGRLERETASGQEEQKASGNGGRPDSPPEDLTVVQISEPTGESQAPAVVAEDKTVSAGETTPAPSSTGSNGITESAPAIAKPIVRFFGHEWDIKAVAVSPDGTRVLSASAGEYRSSSWVSGSDTTIRLWDALTGLELRRFDGHQGLISSVDFSRDGQRFLSSSWDGTIRIWEMASEDFTVISCGTTVQCARFSPDGSQVISAGADYLVRVWDTATGKEIGPALTGHSAPVLTVEVSPDGQTIVSAGVDGTIRLWDMRTHTCIGTPWMAHDDWVMRARFTPDGQRVVSCGTDHQILLWDVAKAKVLRKLSDHAEAVMDVVVSPDGRWILSSGGGRFTDYYYTVPGTDYGVRLWNAETGELLETFDHHTSIVWGLGFFPDGKRALAGSSDKSMTAWVLPEPRKSEKPTSPPLKDSEFWDEVKTLLADRQYGDVRELITRLKNQENNAHLSNDLDLVSAAVEKLELVWLGLEQEITRLIPGTRISLQGDRDHILKGFDPKRRVLLTLSRQLKEQETALESLSSTDIEELFKTRGSNRHPEMRLALGLLNGFDRSGERASARRLLKNLSSDDIDIKRVWMVLDNDFTKDTLSTRVVKSKSAKRIVRKAPENPKLGIEQVAVFTGVSQRVNSLAYHGDLLLVGRSDGHTELWNPSMGQIKQRLQGASSSVYAVAFSNSGRMAAAAGLDGRVHLWRLAGTRRSPTARHLSVGKHASTVWALAFSPDERYLLSGAGLVWDSQVNDFVSSKDNTVRVWDVNTGQFKVLGSHADFVQGLTFLSNVTAVSVGNDKTLNLWNLEHMIHLKGLKPPDHLDLTGFNAVAAVPNSPRCIVADDRAVVLDWNTTTGEVVPMKSHNDIVRAVAVSPDGSLMVSGGDDDTIRVWNLKTATPSEPFKGHRDDVKTLTFCPDGAHFVSGGDDRTFRLLRVVKLD